MSDRGHSLARSSVHNWLSDFLLNDRFRASRDLVSTLMDSANGKSDAQLEDALSKQLKQTIFEQTVKWQIEGVVETKDLLNATAGYRNVIAADRNSDQLRQDREKRERTAVEEASKLAKSGASGDAVAAKVLEILGVGGRP
jgi:uncharacterized protein YktA (UPF0223 family)